MGRGTYNSEIVKSPRILAFNSISISRFASRDSFKPSWSFNALYTTQTHRQPYPHGKPTRERHLLTPDCGSGVM